MRALITSCVLRRAAGPHEGAAAPRQPPQVARRGARPAHASSTAHALQVGPPVSLSKAQGCMPSLLTPRRAWQMAAITNSTFSASTRACGGERQLLLPVALSLSCSLLIFFAGRR